MHKDYFSFFFRIKKGVFIGFLGIFSLSACHDPDSLVNANFIPLSLNLSQPALKVVDQVSKKIEEVLIEQLDDLEYNKKHKSNIDLQKADQLKEELEEMKRDNTKILSLSSSLQAQLSTLNESISKVIDQKIFEKIPFPEFKDFVRTLDMIIGPWREDYMLKAIKPYKEKIKSIYAYIEELRSLFIQPILDKEKEKKDTEIFQKELAVKQEQKEKETRESIEESTSLYKKQIAKLQKELEKKEKALQEKVDQLTDNMILREGFVKNAQDKIDSDQKALEDRITKVERLSDNNINTTKANAKAIEINRKSIANNASEVSTLKRYINYAVETINHWHRESNYFGKLKKTWEKWW